MQSVSAKEIAALLGGSIEGDAEVRVFKPAKIEEGEAGAISFLANPKYEDYVYSCKSSVLLVAHDFVAKEAIKATLIRVADVYSSLSVLLEHFSAAMQAPAPEEQLVHPQAYVDPSAALGEGVRIDALAYVGKGVKIATNSHIYPQVYLGDGVEIGENCQLHPGVRVYAGCKIARNCIIHANAVVGADGFGFAPQADGSFKKVPQLGIVELEENVEIGANTVIDRATMGRTLIESGVKLDNLIQIAHNVVIGKNTVVAAQAGIAGSTKVGQNCLIGGQVGLVGHIEIADGTKIQAQSGINKSIKRENTAVFGSPALPYTDFLKSHAVFKNLPRLQKQVDELRKALKEK